MQYRNFRIIFACLAALGCTGTAWAAPLYTLKGVTVTATRRAALVQDVPGNVQIVTRQDIERRNIQTAAQAVSQAAGVSVSGSEEGTVNLRGYSSKNILVMVDGQPMNTAWNGDVDWNMIPVENIERVEVVSGGQSALYGGRAVGGVINIMTKKPKENGVHFHSAISYGTHDTRKNYYNAEVKKDKWTFGTFYERRSTQGWKDFYSAASRGATAGGREITRSLEDARGDRIMGDRGRKYVLNETYGFNAGYAFNSNQSFNYRYVHSDYLWRYHDPHSYVKKNGARQWPGIDFADSSYSSFYGTRGYRSSDFHSLTYNDTKNGVHGHFGMVDYYKDGYTTPDGRGLSKGVEGPGRKSSYPSQTWDFDLNKRWKLGSHSLLAGASYGQDKFDEKMYTLSNWKHYYGKSELTQKIGGKDKIWALYVQDQWNFAPRWTAYAGGRYDHYEKYDGYSQYPGQDKRHFSSASYSQFSPKLSVNYALRKDLSFYASYGKSFTPPILYQVYRYSEAGSRYLPNPGLKPEKTDTYELGVKKQWGKTTLSADAFWAETKDYIQAVRLPEFRNTRRYENTGKEKTHGVEVNWQHQWTDALSSYINYTWQIGHIEGEHDDDIPHHLLHAGANYHKNAWDFTADGTFISNRTEKGMKYKSGHFRDRDAYFLLNLGASYTWKKAYTFQFNVDNVFDRKYYDQDLSTSHYYRGDGRTYMFTVRINY